jgi:hypothetical protein
MSKQDDYRVWCIGKIQRAANPLGCGTVGLVGKTPQKKFGADVFTLEKWLKQLRIDGVLAFTNGHWWVR